MSKFLKDNEITLDIVIPILNGEKYLLKALKSIENMKTLPNRIIFVDNCSSDKTWEMINNWASNKIYVDRHRNLHKLSFADNWNTALTLAQSEFVHFLAFDDEIHPNFVKNFKKVAMKYRNVEGYIFRVNVINENKKSFIRKISIPIEFKLDSRKHLERSITHNPFNLAGGVFKRKHISKINFMDSNYVIWSDWVLWQNILMTGTIVRSLRIISNYRIHSETEKKLERKDQVEKDLSTLIRLQLPILFDYLRIKPLDKKKYIKKLTINVTSQAKIH